MKLMMMAIVPVMQKSMRRDPFVPIDSVSAVGAPHSSEPSQDHEEPQGGADGAGACKHVEGRVVRAPHCLWSVAFDVGQIGSQSEAVDKVGRRSRFVRPAVE
jgi:hypothetical protein